MTSPDRTIHRGQFIATVAANRRLCREHHRLTLTLASFPPTRAGQFVQIACRDLGERCDAAEEVEWRADRPPAFGGCEVSSSPAFLRRPFSIGGRRDTGRGVELDFILRVVGVGTAWLARLREGDRVDILGPLGNHFQPPVDGTALLIGGGVGIPPMLYFAEELAGRRAVAFCGAVSRDLLPLSLVGEAPADGVPTMCVEEFAQHGIPAVVTTDDGSYGCRGFVTQALERFLDRLRPGQNLGSQITDCRGPFTLYTCGPEAMMKRVAGIAAERGIACQVSVERAMACGMGTCQSCCIRVKKPDPSRPPLAGKDWCYRLACTDGPVFPGADLLW